MAKKDMINRTKLLYQDNEAFMTNLALELLKAKKSANKKGKLLAYRFNGTSDRFEEIKLMLDYNDTVPMLDRLFDQGYDYTKHF